MLSLFHLLLSTAPNVPPEVDSLSTEVSLQSKLEFSEEFRSDFSQFLAEPEKALGEFRTTPALISSDESLFAGQSSLDVDLDLEAPQLSEAMMNMQSGFEMPQEADLAEYLDATVEVQLKIMSTIPPTKTPMAIASILRESEASAPTHVAIPISKLSGTDKLIPVDKVSHIENQRPAADASINARLETDQEVSRQTKSAPIAPNFAQTEAWHSFYATPKVAEMAKEPSRAAQPADKLMDGIVRSQAETAPPKHKIVGGTSHLTYLKQQIGTPTQIADSSTLQMLKLDPQSRQTTTLTDSFQRPDTEAIVLAVEHQPVPTKGAERVAAALERGSRFEASGPVKAIDQSAGTQATEAEPRSDTVFQITPVSTATATMAGPTMSAATQSLQVAIQLQILESIQSSSANDIEIRLEPEQLGKLRILLSPRENGLHVLVLAERPETLDLMRRNVDDLAGYLSDGGYQDASIDFGEYSDREDQTGERIVELDPSGPHDPSAAVVTSGMADSNIDIRI